MTPAQDTSTSTSTSASARFICLEGIDGAGKSGLVGKIQKFLAEQGVESHLTREPGGTPFAEQLAEILLRFKEDEHAETIDAQSELLLFFAARSQHTRKLIIPKLQQGTWIICDRWLPSSYAYQGGGRELGFAKVKLLEEFLPALRPDLVLLLDLDIETAAGRLAAQRKQSDRFESIGKEQQDFISRTRRAYLDYAKDNPNCKIIDAAQTEEEVWQATRDQIQALL